MTIIKKKRKNISIKDVAIAANVSTATVSRVLNSPEKTSEKTRIKVLTAAQHLNYVHRASQVTQSKEAPRTIVLFPFDISNEIDISLIRHLEKIAAQNNYILLVCATENDPETEYRYFETLNHFNTAGIIFMAGTSRPGFLPSNHITPNVLADFPIILFDREKFEDKLSYTVLTDHKKGISLLVDYLYKLNHRRIGYITGSPGILASEVRLNCFKESMNSLGLEVPDHYIFEGDFSSQSGRNAFDYYYSLPDAPTAILASNDSCAKGFITRATNLGVRIPDEFSICGYNGLALDDYYPNITSIQMDTQAIAEAMFKIIMSKPNNRPKSIMTDVKLYPGDTCKKLD